MHSIFQLGQKNVQIFFFTFFFFYKTNKTSVLTVSLESVNVIIPMKHGKCYEVQTS